MKVKCRKCEREIGLKGFSHHLKMLHDTIFIEYVAENLGDFPNYRPCPICKTLTTGDTCSYKCSAEVRKSRIGKDAPRYGAVLSDETKAKIGSANKRIIAENGHWNQGLKHSDETKTRISNSMIERGHSIGEKNGMYGKTHTPEAIKKIMTKRPMNKLEKRVADLLDEHNIDYHYQFFLNRDGVCKSYDFKIKGQPIILEIDGDYWHGGPKAEKYTPFFDLESNMENDKFKNKFAEEHGFKVLRFWESEFNKNPEIILETLKCTNY